MRNVSICLVLTLLLCACSHTPKYPLEYHAKENLRYKATVHYVGTNWQIKDAVNRGELADHWSFHTEDFWKHAPDEVLVTFSFQKPAATAMEMCADSAVLAQIPRDRPSLRDVIGSPGVGDGIRPRAQFEKFFTPSKD